MSTIPFPVTSNHKFQIFNFAVVNDPTLSTQKVNPNYPPINKINNHSYEMMKENSYKYTACQLFDLDAFADPSIEKTKLTEIIAHDQIRFNFNTKLILPNKQTIRYGDILNDPTSYNTYSIQYGKEGINLQTYINILIEALYQHVIQCPVDMRLVDYDHPVFYTVDYIFTDLKGNKTIKTSTNAAYKFIQHTCNKKDGAKCNCCSKVLRWGTGLEEFYVK